MGNSTDPQTHVKHINKISGYVRINPS